MREVASGFVFRWSILIGTPLVLTVLMLFHPAPYSDILGELVPIAGWWTALHTIQFVLFALMGAAIWMLTEGLRGGAVVVSRVAAVIFVVFYDIGDAVAGISTGVLAQNAANLHAGKQAAVAGAIEMLFRSPTKNLAFTIGIYGWILALGAAAFVLYRVGAPRVPLVLMVLPVIFISFFDHAFPFGSLAFGSFFLVALWLELARPKYVPDEDGSYPAEAPVSETRHR